MKSLLKSVSRSAVVVSVSSLVLASSGFCASYGAGSSSIDPKALTIASMKIEEIGQERDVEMRDGLMMDGDVVIVLPGQTVPQKPTDPSQIPSGIPDVDTAHIVLSKIINMGKMVWDVIAANKPVVNVKTDMASALPYGVNGWENLSAWQTPKVREYRVTYQNLYGANVVDFNFRIMYTHGGSVEGKGQFIANATIIPAHLTVGWGFTFNAQSIVLGVLNAGSARDPLAAMQLQLHWSIDTVLKHEENTEDFYIKGDGSFEVLGSTAHRT